MTIGETFSFGETTLAAAGVPDAEVDARILLETVTGMNRSALFLQAREEIDPAQEAEYRELLARRARRIPLQHLLGETEFMGLCFRVDERVLIPRPDTETLVECVLSWEAAHPARGRTVLDLGTGSGCIAVSLARYGSFTAVIGSDISEEALAVARENARRLAPRSAGIALTFRQSDLLAAFPGQRFALIVSNPPYVATADLADLMPEVRDHDPRLALDGGEDGLSFYRRLVRECPGHLIYGGRAFFEIGAGEAADVVRLMRAAGFTDVGVFQDDAGWDRVVTGEWRCLTDSRVC